jgi:hypothetical protein
VEVGKGVVVDADVIIGKRVFVGVDSIACLLLQLIRIKTERQIEKI